MSTSVPVLTFGQILKAARLRKELSQKHVIEWLRNERGIKLTRQSLSLYEDDFVRPRRPATAALADLLLVSPEERAAWFEASATPVPEERIAAVQRQKEKTKEVARGKAAVGAT